MARLTKDELETLDWEAKASKNPLYAVMSERDFLTSDSRDFTHEELQAFWRKGEHIYRYALAPVLERLSPSKESFKILEYGCGMGRILKALRADGWECSGTDISATMLALCDTHVPGLRLFLVDSDGSTSHPSSTADLVFSYAVLQHIKTLSAYTRAVAEMCRCLKPGGVLLLQVNCRDFKNVFPRWGQVTFNFEHFSIHLDLAARGKKLVVHRHNHWSGVYIGFRRLRTILGANGVRLIGAKSDLKNTRSVWITAIKGQP